MVSLVSRVTRTTELRAERIEFDEPARRFITDSLAHDGGCNLIANQRQAGDARRSTRPRSAAQRGMNPVPGAADVLFLEIDVVDPSEFSEVLRVHGVEVGGLPGAAGQQPGRAERDRRDPAGAARRHRGTPALPTSSGPRATRSPTCCATCILGRGDTPPVVREIIRKIEPDPARRPGIHVGG